MDYKQTVAELKEDLSDAAVDLLIDLLEIDLLLRCPASTLPDDCIFHAAVFRTRCFLEQHSADVASIGKLLLERAKESTVSA
nr:hypothetical protein [uncultured Agathobaculum sp.]